MGLNNGKSKTYLKISDGKVSIKVNEGSEGAIKCTNKDGSKVWYEKRHSSISGRIVGIHKRDHDFGSDLCINIEDGGERFELQMPWSSSYATGFFCSMPNIDFDSRLVINPWMKIVEDKKKTALYIKKEGEEESVKWFWTRESPGDCPPMVQIMVKGVLTWDDSARQVFFAKYLKEFILPKLQSGPPSSGGVPFPDAEVEQTKAIVVDETTVADGDLPFNQGFTVIP